MPRRLIDLSHVITDAMVTYPGLPVPFVSDHLTREAATAIYGPDVTFTMGMITMCSNTGTYLDVPFHRYADGHDLTGLALERVADVPGVLVRRLDQITIDLPRIGELDLEGCAVLINTGHSAKFGTADYLNDHPHITEATARALVEAKVACVGIDSLNIDSTEAFNGRPVHSILLKAGIPIIEHLTNLDHVPRGGFRFSAVPPKIEGMGTFTARAYASVPI